MNTVINKSPDVYYVGSDRSKSIVDENRVIYRDKKNKERIKFTHAPMHKITPNQIFPNLNSNNKVLIIARDVIQHMPNSHIYMFLKNIKNIECLFLCSNYIYNDPCTNLLNIIPAGTNNRNMFIDPFNLPSTATFAENDYTEKKALNKYLSIWEIKNKNFVKV